MINTKYRPLCFAFALHYNFTISIGYTPTPRDRSYPNRRCISPNTHTHIYILVQTLSPPLSGGNRTRRALVLNRLNNLITRAADCRERGRSRNGRTLIHRRRFTSFSRRYGTS